MKKSNQHRMTWMLGAALLVAAGVPTQVGASSFITLKGKAEHSAHARLHGHHDDRHGCIAAAPITSEIQFPSTATIGQTITARVNVMTGIDAKNAIVSVDAEDGLSMPAMADAPQTGIFAKDKVYTFNHSFKVDRPGDYTFYVRAEADYHDERMWKGHMLYVTAKEDGSVTISDKKPAHLVNNVNICPEPKPETAEMKSARLLKLSVDEGKLVMPGAAPNMEFEAPATNGLDATITISGWWGYRNGAGATPGGYGTVIEIWDDNVFGDTQIGSAIADGAGNWSVSISDADTGAFPFDTGRADVYVKWRTTNGATRTTNYGGGIYETGIGTGSSQWPDINGSKANVNYYADWGTAGVADDNERAWEQHDYVTRAWEYGNYTLGHDTFAAGFTQLRWEDGGLIWPNWNGTAITMGESDFNSPDIVWHEFGHAYMDSNYAGWPPGAGGSHIITNHYTEGLAWSEGYATAYAAMGQNDSGDVDWYNTISGYSFNYDNNWDGFGSANGNSDDQSTGAGRHGYTTESAVAAFLIDLEDPTNDAYDYADYSDNAINDVFDSIYAGHDIYSVREFIENWHVMKGNLPKFNGQCMTHGMKQGEDRPVIGLFNGVNNYSGTWYFGGYGSAWFTTKNYGSQTYDIGDIWAWLRGPAYEDLGNDLFLLGDPGTLAAGEEKYLYNNDEHVYSQYTPIYGNYHITACYYDKANVFRGMIAGEGGVDTEPEVNIIRDSTEPTNIVVTDDGDCMIPPSKTSISFNVTCTESQSAVDGYWVQLGTVAGSGNIKTWEFYPALNVTNWNKTITGLTLPANQRIYITVAPRQVGWAGADGDTFAYSNGIYAWDATAPTNVSVADDGATQLSKTSLHFVANATEDTCLGPWWYRIYDQYGTVQRDWTQVDASRDTSPWNFTATGLSMINGRTYYVQVAAANESSFSGFSSYGYATSDGIRIANPVTIKGKVQLEDLSAANRQVTFYVGSNVDGGTIWETFNVNLNNLGEYTFQTTRTENVRIMCKTTHWLRQARYVFVNPDTGLVPVNFLLINGDCDKDNYIGTDDYVILNKSFDKSKGDAGYDARADLNEDNYVGTDDYLILNRNFDTQGDD